MKTLNLILIVNILLIGENERFGYFQIQTNFIALQLAICQDTPIKITQYSRLQ